MLPISHGGLGKGAFQMGTQELVNTKHQGCPYTIRVAPFNYICVEALENAIDVFFFIHVSK